MSFSSWQLVTLHGSSDVLVSFAAGCRDMLKTLFPLPSWLFQVSQGLCQGAGGNHLSTCTCLHSE
jgi:hypothetical protein